MTVISLCWTLSDERPLLHERYYMSSFLLKNILHCSRIACEWVLLTDTTIYCLCRHRLTQNHLNGSDTNSHRPVAINYQSIHINLINMNLLSLEHLIWQIHTYEDITAKSSTLFPAQAFVFHVALWIVKKMSPKRNCLGNSKWAAYFHAGCVNHRSCLHSRRDSVDLCIVMKAIYWASVNRPTLL